MPRCSRPRVRHHRDQALVGSELVKGRRFFQNLKATQETGMRGCHGLSGLQDHSTGPTPLPGRPCPIRGTEPARTKPTQVRLSAYGPRSLSGLRRGSLMVEASWRGPNPRGDAVVPEQNHPGLRPPLQWRGIPESAIGWRGGSVYPSGSKPNRPTLSTVSPYSSFSIPCIAASASATFLAVS